MRMQRTVMLFVFLVLQKLPINARKQTVWKVNQDL